MAMNKDTQERLGVIVTKELKEVILEISKDESRSINSFVNNAIKEYIKNNYPNYKF